MGLIAELPLIFKKLTALRNNRVAITGNTKRSFVEVASSPKLGRGNLDSVQHNLVPILRFQKKSVKKIRKNVEKASKNHEHAMPPALFFGQVGHLFAYPKGDFPQDFRP